MFGRSRLGFPPLSPLGGGATSWVACDFLEASSHRRSQMWCLEGDVEDGEELYRDVKEVIDDIDFDWLDDDFEELIEYLDNQRW